MSDEGDDETSDLQHFIPMPPDEAWEEPAEKSGLAIPDISFEGKWGIALGLIALAGGGVAFIRPDFPMFGWGLVTLAALGDGALAIHHVAIPPKGQSRTFGRWFAALVIAMPALVFSGWSVWNFWPESHKQRAQYVHIAHALIVRPIAHRSQNAPSGPAPTIPVPTIATAPTATLPTPRPRTRNAKQSTANMPSAPQAQPLPRADTDQFMKLLRDWYIHTHKDVPAEIVNGTAWPPEDWINQQLEDYERPWRVQTNGSDYVATVTSLSVPSTETVTTYSDGGRAVTHRFPETMRRAFSQALVPPRNLPLIFVYTDGDDYYHDQPQPQWEDWTEEIKSLFPKHGGGWTIDRGTIFRYHPLLGSEEGNGYLEDNYSGWVIQLQDPQNPTDDAKAIMAALKAAGIRYTIATEKGDAGTSGVDIIGITFGRK